MPNLFFIWVSTKVERSQKLYLNITETSVIQYI